MKTIVINTLGKDVDTGVLQALLCRKQGEMEVINTASMDIHHCVGCNMCWLKTPGVCMLKDDYEVILKKIINAGNMWIMSGTHFGFLDYKGKQVMDRIVPMLNINIEFRDGWMRHELRYHPLNVGVIYNGNGDKELLDEWCERASLNLGGHSLGTIALRGKEAAVCM